MGIYIKGMKMPQDREIILRIDEKSEVYVYGTYPTELHKAIPVPPHGRAIDADALWVKINKICDRRDAGIITDLTCLQQLLSAVRHAPTIIPAEEANP